MGSIIGFMNLPSILKDVKFFAKSCNLKDGGGVALGVSNPLGICST